MFELNAKLFEKIEVNDLKELLLLPIGSEIEINEEDGL